MKTTLAILTTALAMTFSVRAADATVKLTDVHLCCNSCVTGAEKIIGQVKGANGVVNKDEHMITLTGPDKATVQKSVDALVAAGFYGKSSDPDIKVVADTGAKDQKVQTLKIEGVHLCCGKCVTSVDEALKAVPGVKEQTAKKGAKSFEVTGDFNDKEAFAALQKAGLTGKVAK
jgi:copper chaperone CopZ